MRSPEIANPPHPLSPEKREAPHPWGRVGLRAVLAPRLEVPPPAPFYTLQARDEAGYPSCDAN